MNMISEQIDKLRRYANDFEHNNHHFDTDKVLRDAADTIKNLSGKLRAANMERSSAHYHGGWIPTEERNPEKNGFYLATCDGKICGNEEPFSGLAQYENGKWVDDEDDYKCVLAWQRLPEPYRAEEKDVNPIVEQQYLVGTSVHHTQ